MIGRGGIRTGIDFGVSSVKLVRGEGSPQLETVTHLGIERVESSGPERKAQDAAQALDRLLHHLSLRRSQLGAIAVAVKREDASIREVLIPSLSPEELTQALPFEARRHLNLEEMVAPILDFQILGSSPAPSPEEGEQIRVLLAAVSQRHRSFPIDALSELGLAPEVIDIEPLAGLNALFAVHGDNPEAAAVALIDLGASGSRVHVAQRNGFMVSRLAGGPMLGAPGTETQQRALGDLAARIRETVTYYWTRYRAEIEALHLAGAGALIPGLAETLGASTQMRVDVFNPLGPLDPTVRVSGFEPEIAALFVTAVGLCRWWDGDRV